MFEFVLVWPNNGHELPANLTHLMTFTPMHVT